MRRLRLPFTRDEGAPRPVSASADETVAPGMRIAAAWSWRFLVVAGVLALVGFLVVQLREIAIPFFVAVLVAALLVPLKNWLVRHRWPRALAVAVCELGLIAIVGGLVTLVVFQVRSGLPAIQKATVEKYDELHAWLQGPPLELSDKDIDGYVTNFLTSLQADTGSLLSGALSVGSTAGHVLAGMLLVLFSLLFLLLDGRHIWTWVTGLAPKRARTAINGAGEAGWVTLTTFVKVQVFVAFVDAVGIGLGAWILGLFFGGFPLVIPIAVLVFLGSFIPVVGAVVTGAVAVFVALVYLGPIPALIMLGIVILVQQVEGHILQPFVIGSAIKVHPLAVVFAVATGGFIAGIPGALFAVPLMASLNEIVRYLANGSWRTNPHPTRSDVAVPVRGVTNGGLS